PFLSFSLLFFLPSSLLPPSPPSFPTRRSSDLSGLPFINNRLHLPLEIPRFYKPDSRSDNAVGCHCLSLKRRKVTLHCRYPGLICDRCCRYLLPFCTGDFKSRLRNLCYRRCRPCGCLKFPICSCKY